MVKGFYSTEKIINSLKPNAKSFFQPKLTVNAPGDQYEQEADAIADRVMRIPVSIAKEKLVTGMIGRSVQRKCSKCEEGEKKAHVMRKESIGSGDLSDSSSFISSLNASKGGGSALHLATRSFMENAFSTDFSGVRIHADSQAAGMNKQINARAFTTGNNIYFNEGQYNPTSNEGKHLLAHELTHTVQQNYSLKDKVQKQGSNEDLNLPSVPHYQLEMPTYQSPLTGKSTSNPYRPDFSVHSNLQLPGGPLSSSFVRRRVQPYFQYIPPVNLILTLQQVRHIIGEYNPEYLKQIPLVPESSADGLRLGGDLFRDIMTGNNQVSAVARGLDVGHFSLFNNVIDVLHEPSLTFSAGTPGGGTENSTQFGLTVLNIHLPHNIELAPVQVGVDTQAGVSLGAQLEIHTPDPHWSYYINFGYSIQPNEIGKYKFTSTGISLSFFPHFLNP